MPLLRSQEVTELPVGGRSVGISKIGVLVVLSEEKLRPCYI